MDTVWLVVIAVGTILVGGVLVTLLSTGARKRAYRVDLSNRREPRVVSTGAQYEYEAGEYIPFEARLRAAGLAPDVNITYGQNYFAHDSHKGKVLLQSDDMPESLLLRDRDILAYTLVKDGQTIAAGPGMGMQAFVPPAASEGVLCRQLRLTLRIRHKLFREAVLPFIFFPVEEAFVYSSAMEAATQAAKALDSILRSCAVAGRGKSSLDA